jgi:hypothetical protein
MKKLNPVYNKERDMSGNVVRRRFRRPNVSIVYMAGIANKKLMIPKPRDAQRAETSLNPES